MKIEQREELCKLRGHSWKKINYPFRDLTKREQCACCEINRITHAAVKTGNKQRVAELVYPVEDD